MAANPKNWRAGRTLTIVSVVLALACSAIVTWHGDDRPVATFLFGPELAAVDPFDEVPKYDAMTLHVEMPFDGYVYVVSFDYFRGTVSYFPSGFLGTDHKRADGRMNSFPAGSHDLPGPWDGKSQAWFVPDLEGALSLCVVVSRAPLADLETVLTLTRQVGNTAFPSRVMSDYMPRAGTDKRLGQRRLPHDVLLAAQNQEGANFPGPMGNWEGHEDVFVKVQNIRPAKPRPGAQPPSNPLRAQLMGAQKSIDKKTKPK
jgi:hypothetical protein